jgi:transcriptional regulator with PAS, ATPase and Fis domain
MAEQSVSTIIGESARLKELTVLAERIAPSDVSVLLTGESGTGKEVFAKFIHERSRRREAPYIPINCGAIPQSILESELFGHERGAFTGADKQRKGYFESADSGTIFLDEIGELPLETQVKLLRVLESGEFQRVGASETIRTDVRVIAATNRDLLQQIRAKEFREDLYFRLKTVELKLPPLRERGNDILLLAEKFIRDFEKKHRLKFVGFTSDATELLLSYYWSGNIRELRNLIESLLVLERDEKIAAQTLLKYLQTPSLTERIQPPLAMPLAKQSDAIMPQELVYRALLQLQTDVSDVKSMLLKLSEQRSSANEPPTVKPVLYLPEPKPELPESTLQTESLRDLLESFYTSHSATGDIPTLEELERYAIEQTLRRVGNNKRKAAEVLGITERTLYRKLSEYKGTNGENASS